MVVLERKMIEVTDLENLFNKDILAIRINNYIHKDVCNILAKKLLDSKLHGKYINAPKIGRVGQSFFEGQASEFARKRYAEQSVSWLRQMRKECAPYLTPIDKLRVELDEIWQQGSKLHSISNNKMFAGLAREFDAGSYTEPHQDVIAWDAPEANDAKVITKQLAVNVYLKMPESGGNLALWDSSLKKSEYERLRIPGSYGVKKEKIGEPADVLTPEIGELIIFNSHRIHEVQAIEKGSRVSWSTFIGLVNKDSPLSIFS